MRGLLILALFVLAALVIIVMIANPDPGDPCTSSQKGVSKFHSTGKIVECDGTTWVLKNGTPP